MGGANVAGSFRSGFGSRCFPGDRPLVLRTFLRFSRKWAFILDARIS